MYIGKLNDRLDFIRYSLTKKNLVKTPVIAENGNPFFGERLRIAWMELLGSGVDLHISLPEFDILNTVSLTFGDNSAPASVSLYTPDKRRLLYRYSGETGRNITQRVLELPVEEAINDFVIEFDVNFSDVIIDNIELYGASFDGERLFPSPKEYVSGVGAISVSALRTFNADCQEAIRAAEILAEKLDQPLISAENAVFKLSKHSDIPANAYSLSIDASEIRLSASDLKGFVQGVETLIKLVDGGSIPACTIHDEPFMAMRGVHIHLPAEEQMDFAKRLVKYILSPMGYNLIIMELAGAMEYESHPEINAAVLDAYAKEDAGLWPPLPHGRRSGDGIVRKSLIRDFIAYARSFGIDVIPEIQSLGHVQFMTLAHPDIAERPADAPVYEATDERMADIPPSDFFAHSACPCNPKTYEILFDLIDEIVEVFQPKEYVHMGHDEVYQIGVCPICKDKNPADLLAGDLNKIHDYLARKGLKMMIWSDMLQPCSSYKTVDAIHKIPKDIFFLDFIWYFHPEKDIEDGLLPHGFKYAYGNMYSSHFPRYETRIRKPGVCGAEVSTWVSATLDQLAGAGKLYDFLYTAQMLWSDRYVHQARYSYDKMISALIPRLREQLEDTRYPSLCPDSRAEVLVDNGPFDPSARSGGSYPVSGRCSSLVFEHAASLPFRKKPFTDPEIIGRYIVSYENGSELQIPVTYAGNISHWNRRHNQPFTHMYHRHTGYSATWYTDGIETKTPSGELATLYRYEWINPQPDIPVCRITYVPAEDAETDVILHRLIGIR